jgi:hypothetical protein
MELGGKTYLMWVGICCSILKSMKIGRDRIILEYARIII